MVLLSKQQPGIIFLQPASHQPVYTMTVENRPVYVVQPLFFRRISVTVRARFVYF
jgi:hypothetical protein